jgi:hypothetical protein
VCKITIIADALNGFSLEENAAHAKLILLLVRDMSSTKQHGNHLL